MKMNRQLILLSLLLTSCGGITGQLKVTQAFSLLDRWNKVHEISAGSQSLTLQYKENKHRLILTFNDANETLEISTPESFSIPENGAFEMKSQDSGQSVDLQGTVQTSQRKSAEMVDRQACQTTAYEPVCSTGPNGQTSCSTQAVTKWGTQDVRYYNLETRQMISATFTSSQKIVGEFDAGNTWNERRELYKGPCW